MKQWLAAANSLARRRTAMHLGDKKWRECFSHLFVQIGTIIAGNGRTFNTQIKQILQQIVRNY